ncbi:NHLP leader peptide family natural product precursor [Sphaerospermopsis sp. FACHB-1094]|uniref:NHLP leader peptide family RiPP precursor n=1 Tax=Sphaerospermopsis sp. FACHB-1094 TaxID=2692861 RepID=UPI001684E7A5|nr:NHLP leader peptide family RiPP precursor [Sphaerospermopsis sp. FACHB-1094]MBD2131439.1 NHLP leader peptide family natural product precursor [Sphaerospermopsis sp. FACHB-1094]
MTQAGSHPSDSELEFLDEQLKARMAIQSSLVAKSWLDESFKEELISDPKGVIERELGTELADDVEIQVIEETPTTFYLSIPVKPSAGVEGELSDEELEAVAGGKSIEISVKVEC